MKNLKKLFASVASVAILASLIPTATLGAASYSDELQEAYDYAYNVGITTQSSIDAANMYGTLTRAHMAKMMVNFAKEVFNQEPDTSKECNFTDLAGQTEEMKGYIEESCQLGLMGVGITAFNPNGAVTRAQFGTVLSRVLRGDENEGGTPYYSNHLEALKDAGIMNNISNPMANEIRGYVMLMMMRADSDSETPAICETPENQTACSLGLDTCPAECQEDVDNGDQVKAGDLDVSLNSDSLKDGANIPMVGTIKFAAVDFEAGSEDVNLNSVEISKVGLSDIPSGTKVRFELDGKRISGRSTFSSEGKAVISFAPVYVVKADSTATLDLYAELSTTAGQDIQFESSNFDTSAEDVSGDFTTPKLRTATYTVAPVAFDKASNGGTFNVVETAMELGAFKVSNNDTSSETRDVELQTITLRQNGNGSLDNLSNIVLERNGVVVSKNPTTDGKDLTFSIGDTIKDGTTATYYIKAKVTNVDNSDGDTYTFALRQNTDLNAVEIKNGFRSTVTGYTALNTYTIKGGDIRFAKDSATELSANYAAGSEDVILMKGTINVKAPVTLEDITSIATATTGLADYFTTIYLKIGSSTFSYSPAGTEKTAKFYGSVTVNSTSTVTMYGKLKDNAPAGDIKFEDLKLSSFTRAEYVSTSNTVSSGIGSIAGVNVTVQLSKLNVTRNDGLGNTSIAQGTKGYNAYGIKLTSDQGNGVTVSNATFAISSTQTGKLYNNADLTLYVNGKAVQTKTINGASISFDSFSLPVNKTTPGTLELKADLTDAFDAGTLQITLTSMNVVDTLTSKDVTSYAKPVGALLTVLAADATIAASDNNPQAQLFLSPSTAQKLIAFKVTAKNDDVKLYNVKLSGTGLAGLSNFVIVDSANAKIADVTASDNNSLEFTQIANAPKILKDKSETYYVVADVNTNTTLATVNATVTDLDIKGTNGVVKAHTGLSIASRTHGTAENTLVVAKATNGGKLLTTSAMRFTVTAAGKDAVTLDSLNFSNALAGYSGAAAKIVVYKDSITAGNIAGQTSAGTYNGSVTLTANKTVDAGSTVTYIVAIEGAIIDPAANTTDWSVSLTNVVFGGLNANAYYNAGSFPMTETK